METSTAPARSSQQRGFVLALLAGLALYAWLWAHFDFVCDDAYISFRYARRLAEGHGLRFNLAESPPVEGYSNLLWVLWLAPFERLGADLRTVATLSSGLCGALLVVLTVRFARRRMQLDGAALVATALALASLPPFAVWSSGGLESMAFALAVFVAFERLALDPAHPRILAAGLAGAAAVLLRADGALWLTAVLGAAWLGAPREHSRALLRAAFLAGLVAAAFFAAQIAFRVAYHHEWIPNTARVKAGLTPMRLERGFKYVASLLLELPFLAILPLCVLVWPRVRVRLALASAAVVAFSGAYVAFVGGDFMAMGRFVMPAMPFVALVFAALAGELGALRGGRAVLGALSALVLASSLLSAYDRWPVPTAWRQSVHFRWNESLARSEAQQWLDMRTRADEWARIGRAFAPFVTPGESIVLPNLGAISYYTELHAFDPFGLVSPEVAGLDQRKQRASPGHDRGVPPSYFYGRRPDYLGAWIAPVDAPIGFGLSPGYSESELARVSRVEHHALPAGAEYPAGQELRVLHMTWQDDSK